MASDFRAYHPEQIHLLPSSPREWLSEDHLAYCVEELVKELDLSSIEASYSSDGRGAPAYPPRMMVSVLIYAWCNGVFSSRKIARLCRDDLGGRYLAAGHTPDFRSISGFRLQHGEALQGFFLQSLVLCQRAGMVSLGHVALDGTKVAANASKHKAMSYGRMVEDEARLVKEIEEMMKRATVEDAAEDAQFGKEQAGSALSEELARREGRLSKIREAKAALEEEARAAAEQKLLERAEEDRARAEAGQSKKRGKQPADPTTVSPKEKAQRNFTDPESRIMKGGDGAWVQGYNGQAAVDADHQVIVAQDLTQQGADPTHLEPMIEQVCENTGFIPAETSADAGYFSETNVAYLEALGSEVLIPPDRQRHGSPQAPAVPLTRAEMERLSTSDRQRYLTSTASGRAKYARRKITVEPVFGQIKGCPAAPGFRGFLRRGLKKCRQEWGWICATHNFKKYIRFQLAQKRLIAAT